MGSLLAWLESLRRATVNGSEGLLLVSATVPGGGLQSAQIGHDRFPACQDGNIVLQPVVDTSHTDCIFFLG